MRLSPQYRQAVRRILKGCACCYQGADGLIIAILPTFRRGKYLGELEFTFDQLCIVEIDFGPDSSIIASPGAWRLIDDMGSGLSLELLA